MHRIVLIGAGSTNFGLGVVGDIFKSNFLEGSTIILHDINAKALDNTFKIASEYKEKLEEFEMTRKYLTEVFGLNQTLKMHVIKEHFKTYFKMTGKTLKDASTEYHEAVHHSHKSHEKKMAIYLKTLSSSSIPLRMNVS